jgi:hypothetical protein
VNTAGWRDEAILSEDQDEFGRSAVADHIARLVATNHTFDASRVYALTGPWGSGKTSVINMVCKRLEHLGQESLDERWVVARFTPWATNSTDALLVEFYSALSDALGGEPRSKKARRALGACLQATAPVLGLVPTLGSALSETARAGSAALLRQKPWERAFTEFTRALNNMKVRVLVVADDIDRLQHDELATLLKVVRLLGRFPGVDYLVAYDEATLFSSLSDAGVGTGSTSRARLFMEKIIQYPLALPPLLAHQILSRIDQGFAAALEGRPGTTSASSRIERLQDVIVRQLTTPRSIDRYLAQVRFVLSMHPIGEADDVDLLLVTLLRLQFPSVYAQLTNWRGQLTGHKTLSDLLKERRGEKTNFDPLFSSLSGVDRDDAFRLVKELFPIVDERMSRSGRGAPHVSDHFYFDRYIVHMVPSDDIADASIADVLAVARREGTRSDTLRALLTTETTPGLPDLALHKLRKAAEPETGDLAGENLNLIAAIANVLPDLARGPNALFRRQDLAVYWAADLVRSLPADVDAPAISAALNECADLPLRIQIVSKASNEAGETYVDERHSRSHTLDAVAAEFVEDAIVYSLDHLAARDEAEQRSGLLSVLYYLVREGELPRVRARLHEQLGNSFTVEDLAARCVSLAYTMTRDPVGQLEGFVTDLFANLAPADDPFYDSELEDVDAHDLTWANRRRFARGRAQRSNAVSAS